MKKLNIRQFGIGTLMKCRPLISFDSKYLLTIGDQCIYIWIVQTGQCLRSINKVNDQHLIISMAFNPNNRLQLCVAQENGQINIWDYEDGIQIHTIELSMEIVQIFSVWNRSLFIFGKNSKNIYSLNSIESIRHEKTSPLNVILEKLPSQPKSISFDQQGNFCVFINVEGTIVYLFNFLTNQMKNFVLTKQNLSFHEKIICAEIHPKEECLALGTQSGRIALWYDFFHSTTKEATVSYLHWHSLPVLCLAFSIDGSYLLSGGHECVLVKWLYRRSEPTFRPRLGAPIKYLTSSNDQTFYVSTHCDNTLHVINSHLTIRQTIAGINQFFLGSQMLLPAGIHLFLRQRSIVMNSGKPGHLQFLSIDHGKLLYHLDVVGENYVSPNELSKECQFTDVKRMSIDSSENWFVTFEERSTNLINEDFLNERKLRFWKFNSQFNQFELNTTISYPHGQETLNQMLFHPVKLELSTTGDDGFIKIWLFVEENPVTKRNCHWRCFSGQSHRSYRSFALCYYQLSSNLNEWNLCCSFEHLINVWKDEKNSTSNFESNEKEISIESQYEYSRCFSHYDRKDLVKSIDFGCDTILVCHQTLVNLWNAINGSFLRSFPWNVHSIARDPQSSFIALFQKSFLHFYSFSDGKCHTRKSSLFRQVTSATFIPQEKSSSTSFSPFQKSKLIFSIAEQGLKMLFDDEEDEEHLYEKEIDENLLDDEETNQSEERKQRKHLLAKLIVESQKNLQENSLKRKNENSFEDLTKIPRKLNLFEEQFLTSPSYLFPSIDHFCIQSLKEMLNRNSHQTDLNKEKSSNEIDEISMKSFDSDLLN